MVKLSDLENANMMDTARALGIDTEPYQKWAEVVDNAIPDFDFDEAHAAFEAGIPPELYVKFVKIRRLDSQTA